MDFTLKLIFWLSLAVSIHFFNRLFPTLYPYLSPFLQLTGYILVVYGMLLNIVAGRTLKKFGHRTPTKGFSQPDRVVNEGIFSCMRHPAIFGLIFILIGLSMTIGKLITTLYGFFLVFLGEYFIMAVEERQTLKRFGNDYCNFIKSRPPFSFSPICLYVGIKTILTKKDKPS